MITKTRLVAYWGAPDKFASRVNDAIAIIESDGGVIHAVQYCTTAAPNPHEIEVHYSALITYTPRIEIPEA